MGYRDRGVIVIVKPSHRCNLNCVYCYDRFERSRNKKIMDKEDLVKCLDMFAKSFRFCEFIWHGGEPTFLGLDYVKYVMQQIEEKNPAKEIHWSIQTNGTLLTEE